MPAWLLKGLYYLGGFLLEKIAAYWIARKQRQDEKAEQKKEHAAAKADYEKVMRDPLATAQEKEHAYQIFIDRTRPRS